MNEKKLPSFKFLPLTIGLETLGGISTPLVLRGSPLPTSRKNVFSTAEDNQTVVTIRLVMGERPLAKHNLLLDSIDLGDIPPAPRGVPEIEVNVTIDTQCRLDIVAVERRSGNQLEVNSKEPELVLDENTVQRLLDEAEENREADQSELREQEIRNKANQLLTKGESVLKDPSLIPGINSQSLNQAVAGLGLAMQSDDIGQIQAASLKLETALKSSDDIFSSIFGDIFNNTRQPMATSSKPSVTKKKARNKRNHKRFDRSAEKKLLDNRYHVFGSGEFTLDPSLCFVLMPFEKLLKPVYDDHIRNVIEGESLICIRADEIVGIQQVISDIWEYINRARFIIADLTNMNANVFYELGLAHALGKQVILLTQSIDFVPFDLKAHRCLVYEYTPRGMRALEQKLRRTIREVINA